MLAAVSAEDLITSALDLIGVLGEGETPNADQAANALIRLNRMIDRWATQRLTIYATDRNSYTLVSGTQTYTIGSGGTFNQERPLWIPYASVVPTGTNQPEIPVAVLSIKDWANKAIKGQGVISGQTFDSTFPTEIYYDYGFAVTTGLGVITVWPVPTTACDLVLYTPTALTKFADLSTQYVFPPGYQDAIEYNLARRLAQSYDRMLNPDEVKEADDSLADIKRANRRLIDLSLDRAVLPRGAGGFNWMTGQYDR